MESRLERRGIYCCSVPLSMSICFGRRMCKQRVRCRENHHHYYRKSFFIDRVALHASDIFRTLSAASRTHVPHERTIESNGLYNYMLFFMLLGMIQTKSFLPFPSSTSQTRHIDFVRVQRLHTVDRFIVRCGLYLSDRQVVLI